MSSNIQEEPICDRSFTCSVKCIDECVLAAGSDGPFQQRVILILSIYAFLIGMFVQQQQFIFKPVQFNCTMLQSPNCKKQVCQMPVQEQLSYAINQSSLSYKFGLFCQKEWRQTLYKSLPNTLSILGYLIYGFVGDSTGRQTAFKISTRFALIGILLYSSAQRETVVIFGLIIASVHFLPSLLSGFVIVGQTFRKRLRQTAISGLFLCISCGQLANTLLSLTMDYISWNGMLYLISVPWLLVLMLSNGIMQSPYFIFYKSKSQAISLLNRIAILNSRKPLLLQIQQSKWYEEYDKGKAVKQRNKFMFLFKYKQIWVPMLIGCWLFFNFMFIEFSTAASVAGFSVLSKRLTLQLCEIMGGGLLVYGINQISHRKWLLVLQVVIMVSGSLMLIITYTGQQAYKRFFALGVSAIINASNQVILTLLLLWMVQYFPTRIRTRVLGLGLCSGSLGVFLAYLLSLLGNQIAISIGVAFNAITLMWNYCRGNLPQQPQLPKDVRDQFKQDTFFIVG